MLAITLATSYFILLVANTATAKGGRSPVAMTERGSGALVFLERNPRAGTPHSRARLARRSKWRIWTGLSLAGVARFDYRSGDLDPASPFGCIHIHESRNWHIFNPPYSGGLQFDSQFGSTYGPEYTRLWGLAGNWPVWAQVVAAYRAWRTRGYEPWPSTSRYCGLR